MAIYDLVTIASYTAGALLTYVLTRLLYNVYLHPLARLPGPWWAAASYLPEFYYDAVKGGQYFKKVEMMHGFYGE